MRFAPEVITNRIFSRGEPAGTLHESSLSARDFLKAQHDYAVSHGFPTSLRQKDLALKYALNDLSRAGLSDYALRVLHWGMQTLVTGAAEQYALSRKFGPVGTMALISQSRVDMNSYLGFDRDVPEFAKILGHPDTVQFLYDSFLQSVEGLYKNHGYLFDKPMANGGYQASVNDSTSDFNRS